MYRFLLFVCLLISLFTHAQDSEVTHHYIFTRYIDAAGKPVNQQDKAVFMVMCDSFAPDKYCMEKWKVWPKSLVYTAIVNSKDTTGVKEGYYRFYNFEGQLRKEGEYVNGVKNGNWVYYYPFSEDIRFINKFDKGKHVKFTAYGKNHNVECTQDFVDKGNAGKQCFNEKGEPISCPPGDPYFVPPSPSVDMIQFLGSNLKFPESAKKVNQTIRVMVSFFVDGDGNISNISVAKGANADCDADAKRVIEMMPPWYPGFSQGRESSMPYTQPISFTSSGK